MTRGAPRSSASTSIPIAVAVAVALLAGPLAATQVKIFRTQSQAAFLAGTLSGVSVDSLGSVELAPRSERLTALGEPFLLAAAALPDGWVVGTGNAGRVLEVDRQGKVSELFAAPEPEVFAVWADRDGTVFAGTSPRGKVYRIPKAGAKGAYGPAEVFYDPGETYIWALARGADGALLVATGTQGKLFRVEGKGRGRVLYDGEDTHLRSLLALPGGDVLVGTAGEGLILRIGPDGRARTVYDAAEPEVVALAAGPDGSCYAAVVASDTSLNDLTKPPAVANPPAPGGGTGGGGRRGRSEPQPTVTVTVEGDPGAVAAVAAAASGGKGAVKSELLRIAPTGVVERLWAFADDTIYSLLWQDGSLWVGTGLEGKLYRWAGGNQMLLEKDVDERQIVALLPGVPGLTFATTNAAAIYRVTAGREAHGTYTSATLDAGQVASFGSFRWRGEAPAGSAVRLSFRTGMSGEPDRTWSPWTAAEEGEEVSLARLARGRYIQWRAELLAGGGGAGSGSPRLYSTELSYRQENLRPRIEAFAALEPGQILVPANFNPGNQAYEPAHPSREGIFTTLEAAPADEAGRFKPLWKKGYRSLRWTASDPNDDKLTYDLSFRPAGGPPLDAARGGGWLKMAEDVDEDHYSFDATSLPDGVYRFRLVASDRKANDAGTGLAADQVSEPVVVDQTPPALVGVTERGGMLHVTVRDALSPIREAVVSVDAGDWKPVVPEDGLLDAQRETLLVPAVKKGDMLLLRVTDAAYNVVTYDLSRRP